MTVFPHRQAHAERSLGRYPNQGGGRAFRVVKCPLFLNALADNVAGAER